MGQYLIQYSSINLVIFHGTEYIKPFSANPTKWSNTLKQFVGSLQTNRLTVIDHFVGLAFKGLNTRLLPNMHKIRVTCLDLVTWLL